MAGMVLIFHILINVIEKKTIITLVFYNVKLRAKGINSYLTTI